MSNNTRTESKFGHDRTGHDIPPICPRCEIPKYDGYTHINMVDCIVAMKAYIALCQDDIEQMRMRDFEHPTRDELLTELLKFMQYMDATSGMLSNLSRYMASILHGTLLPYANRTAYDPATGQRRHYESYESSRIAQYIEQSRQDSLDERVIRELLQNDVPHKQEDLVQNQKEARRDEDHPGGESAQDQPMRPDVSPETRLSCEGEDRL